MDLQNLRTDSGPSNVNVLDDLDPCLSEGHRVVYDREVQFEVRVDDLPEGASTFESLRVKLLLLGADEVCGGRRSEACATPAADSFYCDLPRRRIRPACGSSARAKMIYISTIRTRWTRPASSGCRRSRS
jgi:hypothetical protein